VYIGTNQGLFYRKINSKEPFQFIEGTAGQVWDLFNYNDETLFCGHHMGTFLVENNKVTLIDNDLGAWTFKTVPNRKNLLLKGNYKGLSILENTNDTWIYRNKINGFNNSSRFFEIDSSLNVWVGHEYKGVFKLQLNDSLTRVINQSMEPSLSIGKNSSITKYKNDILYAFEKGVYKYNKERETFECDSILSPIISEDNYTSGKLIVDEKDRLWAFSRDNIYFISNDHLTNLPKIDTISIPSNYRKMILGYENISLLNDDTYLLGTANGYLTIDISKIKKDKIFKVYLNMITLKDKNDSIFYYNPKEKEEFEYNKGLLLFDYSVPNYDKYEDIKYQYILDGHINKWSDWANESKVQFENLGFGNYIFKVKAKIGNTETSNIETYYFTIKRPWYLSNLALLLYFLLLAMIGFVVHRAYKRHYHKKLKRKQLESDQLIMQIKNEQLNNDIESKNRELTISKMSIIKKNELLNAIKKELNDEDEKPSKNVKSVVKLIDKNLNNTKDWEFFVKAFNNTDKGFLDRLKVLHPDLTPNDLRFCVYLRMNLSSKEMAPLLNISVKSVETKRYRLRKRMNLEHEESLVNYIMDI
ncbi:MAG: LuxR family transcriptional regulator, partial [Flavobacteriaceae bacterium]|nr:LuxR family transcriptional regulator [Flavobacteriaceae bacterium]